MSNKRAENQIKGVVGNCYPEKVNMSEDFYKGMISFEQMCEDLLVRSELSEETQEYIQTQILDKAQAIIESQNEMHLKRSKSEIQN